MAAHILLSIVGQKTETRFNCLLTENRKSTEMVGTPFSVRKLLPPLRRSPSLDEGGLEGLRAPSRIFFYYSGSRVATLVVSMGVMGFLGDLRGRNSKSPPNPLGLAERVYSFHRCGGPPPSRREVWGFAGQALRPCRRLDIGALRSPLSSFARPLEAFYTTPGAGSQPCSFQWGLWGS